MNLLTPAALALIPPLLGTIVVLYMLKLRREDRRVPSTLLWRALRQDPPANTPWQRLRWSVLLALQLLFLGLLIFALARPYVATREIVGETLILLLDRSATMAATDVAPSRLEAAKRQLLDLVDSAAGARITVIAFDQDLEVLAAGQTDPAAIRAAVSAVQPSAVRGDATDALAFAGALAEGQADAQIAVFSDGRFTLAPDAQVDAPVRFVRIGESDDNQAITALAIDPGSSGRPAELFVQLANAARKSATRRVEVRLDGTLVDARDLTLPAGAREGFTLALPEEVGVVEARLAGADALPLDDAAWAVQPRLAQAQVALVSDGNRFLDSAIGLLPSVASVTQVGSEAMEGPYGMTDVAVLDGLTPQRLPPGNLLVIGPTGDLAPGDPGAITYAGQLESPLPRVVLPDHPLVADSGFGEVAILSASALELGPAWTPIVVAEVDGKTWPLVAQGTVLGRPAVLVAFDLRQSDLPLRPAFPLLAAAALEILAPSRLAGVPAAAAPGDPVPLRLPPRATAARVIDPTGRRHELAIEDGTTVFADTAAPGAYTVEVDTDQGTETAAFTVNLGSADPLDIRPAVPAALAAGGAGNQAPGTSNEPGGDSDATAEPSDAAPQQADQQNQEETGDTPPPSTGRRELWWPIGLLCLALLSAEWLYDHRATLRRRLSRARPAA